MNGRNRSDGMLCNATTRPTRAASPPSRSTMTGMTGVSIAKHPKPRRTVTQRATNARPKRVGRALLAV